MCLSGIYFFQIYLHSQCSNVLKIYDLEEKTVFSTNNTNARRTGNPNAKGKKKLNLDTDLAPFAKMNSN